MSGRKIIDGLKQAIEGGAQRRTQFLVTNLKEARRMERLGHSYTWEIVGGRPTGRCIVKLSAPSTTGDA